MGDELGGEMDRMLADINPEADALAEAEQKANDARNRRAAEEADRLRAAAAEAEARKKQAAEDANSILAATKQRNPAQGGPPVVAPQPPASSGPVGIVIREQGEDSSDGSGSDDDTVSSSESDSDDDGPQLPVQQRAKQNVRQYFAQGPAAPAAAPAAPSAPGSSSSHAAQARQEDGGGDDDWDRDPKDPMARRDVGGGSADDPGAGAATVADAEDKPTVMVVHGPSAATKLPEAQAEIVEDLVAKFQASGPRTPKEVSDMTTQTRDWVSRGFSQKLPVYKKAARKLTDEEVARNKARHRNAASNWNTSDLTARRATSSELVDEEDFETLALRANHHTTPEAPQVRDLRTQLKEEYECFMREERCRILRVISRAREQNITCDAAEEELEKDVERDYMERLLDEAEESSAVSQCLEARQMQEVPHPKGKDLSDENRQVFLKELGKYIELLKGNTDPKRKATEVVPNIKDDTNCDPCDEWTIELPWLAKTRAEEDRIRQSAEYILGMRRIMHLRSELKVTKAERTWPAGFTAAFNADPLARHLTPAELAATDWSQFGCVGGKPGKGMDAMVVKAKKEAQAKPKKKEAQAKPKKEEDPDEPQGQRVLDLIMRCRLDSFDPAKTNTRFLETEMLRCFPLEKQHHFQINSVLDFLCWYNQHITLAAQAGGGTSKQLPRKNRELFFKAVCAPFVGARRGNWDPPEADAARAARVAAGEPAIHADTEQEASLYYSLDTRYDHITRSAASAFKALVIDLEAKEKSILRALDEAEYGRWYKMYHVKPYAGA
jgi:hypothetical protein